MKNYLKTSKWLRWVAAGAFGLMLVLNIMVSLEFDKDKVVPSITLIELGNKAMAQGESGGNCSFSAGGFNFPCTRIWCQSTWSMSGCGLGDVNSQVCNSFSSC
ncbi:hypothetical protein [Arthrospiribacter ruber]|uniref:Uncharacterized protein n=1 Tax=Arthrospiribacter ruber TaxID=2487934 RepID=A0A951MCI7_9BACT|nr:hypothetical protein [Arthrospiribacter ruber]MBW3466960.1 hypothetical protein [Arthrospiribacter ruber]